MAEDRSHARLSGAALVLQATDRFHLKSTIGVGTFGAVFRAYDAEADSDVAIKKVFLDPRFKNRELDIVQKLAHPNCLRHIGSYTTTEGRPPHTFLHLVTDFFPGSLSTFMTSFRAPSVVYVKVFGFQVFAALAYLHAHGVCHRDIKPSNVLVDHVRGRVQLCDFGSAKFLKPDEPSISYIATRSYRAPELLLECPCYTTAIDIWAAGCVLAECFLEGKPLFTGANNVKMMNSITRTIGLPQPGDFDGFPRKRRYQPVGTRAGVLKDALPHTTPDPFIDLLQRAFVYAPEKRATAADCMMHPFFAEVVDGSVALPSGCPLPGYLKRMRTPEDMLANFPDGP
jgi:serine/threonine protein kinase